MLTIEELREALKSEIKDGLTAQEFSEIRHAIHALASIFVDSFLETCVVPIEDGTY